MLLCINKHFTKEAVTNRQPLVIYITLVCLQNLKLTLLLKIT